MLVGAGFAVVVLYGSWFPLRFEATDARFLDVLRASLSARAGRADALSNFLLCMPAAYLWMRGLALRGLGAPLAVGIAALGGAAISLVAEYGQLYVPGRSTSAFDMLFASLGALTAACAAANAPAAARRLDTLAPALEAADRFGRAVRWVLIAWCAARTTPFYPTLEPSALWGAVKALVRDPLAGFQAEHAVFHAAVVVALASLIDLVRRDPLPRADEGPRWWQRTEAVHATLVALLLAAQVGISHRTLSAASLVGAAAGLALAPLRLPAASALLLAVGYALRQDLHLAGPEAMRPFHSAPMASLVEGSALAGLASFLEKAFVYGALASLVLAATRRRAALAVIPVYALASEWIQRRLPDRYPDITDPLMATGLCLAIAWAWSTSPGRDR